jgi:hypothetical protein
MSHNGFRIVVLLTSIVARATDNTQLHRITVTMATQCIFVMYGYIGLFTFVK